MKIPILFLLLLVPCTPVFSADPAPPAKEEAATAPAKEVAVAATLAGAEFNRLRETNPEFQKVTTVAAALDSLAASQAPTHKALNKDDLAKHRAEVITLLLMQNGQITGAPALNKLVVGTQATTVGAKARRNAQNIVSIFSAARAAGSPELAGVQNAGQAVAFVRIGVKGGGQFAGSLFKADVDDVSLKAAMTFIGYAAQQGLTYNPGAVLEEEDAPAPVPEAPDAVAMVGRQLKMQAEMEAKRKSQ